MEKAYEGIYYITDKVPFPTQVIVTKELDGKQHTWLKSLSDKMEEVDMRRLLQDASRLKEKLDRAFADSILEVCLKANGQVVERLKGDDTMSEEVLEILMPLVEPILAERERVFEIKIRKEVEAEARAEAEAKVKEAEAKAEAKVKEAEARAEAKVKEAEAKAKMKDMVILLRSLGHDDSAIKTVIMKQYHLSEKEVNDYLEW